MKGGHLKNPPTFKGHSEESSFNSIPTLLRCPSLTWKWWNVLRRWTWNVPSTWNCRCRLGWLGWLRWLLGRKYTIPKTIPKTDSKFAPEKNGGFWKVYIPFFEKRLIFRCELLVLGRVTLDTSICKNETCLEKLKKEFNFWKKVDSDSLIMISSIEPIGSMQSKKSSGNRYLS